MLKQFPNPQDLSIQYLYEQEGKELESRLLFRARPEPQEIIDFLDKIYNVAESTNILDDFELALDLLQKWRAILLSFYNRNYGKIVSRSADSFTRENRSISNKNKKLRNLALGRVSQSKLEEVTKQEEAKENISPGPPPSEEYKARLRKLPCFPQSIT